MTTQSKGAHTLWNSILITISERKLFLGIPLITCAIFVLISIFGNKELKDVVDFLTFRK
jgi:hypothetical protein